MKHGDSTDNKLREALARRGLLSKGKDVMFKSSRTKNNKAKRIAIMCKQEERTEE